MDPNNNSLTPKTLLIFHSTSKISTINNFKIKLPTNPKYTKLWFPTKFLHILLKNEDVFNFNCFNNIDFSIILKK